MLPDGGKPPGGLCSSTPAVRLAVRQGRLSSCTTSPPPLRPSPSDRVLERDSLCTLTAALRGCGRHGSCWRSVGSRCRLRRGRPVPRRRCGAAYGIATPGGRARANGRSVKVKLIEQERVLVVTSTSYGATELMGKSLMFCVTTRSARPRTAAASTCRSLGWFVMH